MRVLGGLEVIVDGSPVDLGGPKQRALLAVLVAAEGRTVSVERLIDLLWGEDPPDKVLVSIQAYVAKLRRVLEPGRGPRAAAEILVTRPPGYALVLDGQDVDARRFVEMTRKATPLVDTDPATAHSLLTSALGLWRGEAYGGVTTSCSALATEAARLEDLRLTALEDLLASQVAMGDHARAVAELERLVAAHPLRERAWSLLALGLYRAGRQGDALDALRRARRQLANDLGVDPGAELRWMEEAVLRQDPELDVSPAPDVDPYAAASAQPVGRDEMLEAAGQVLRAAVHRRGRVVLVSGEPGIGKTCLAHAIMALAAAAGFRRGYGAWEPDSGPSLSGWKQALRQLLGDGETLEQAQGWSDAASTTLRHANALSEALGTGPASLIVLDDVHWADTDSLRLLRRIAAVITGLPVVLVVVCRDAESEISPPLAESLGALARLDPLRLELRGLDERAVAAHVRAHTGVEVSDKVAAAIRGRTDGNPFYINEFVRLVAAEGNLADPTTDSWRRVPGGVRDVVRQRLAQLPDTAPGVLAAGAVLGRSFDLDIVEDVSGLGTESVDDAVEAAAMAGLLEEEAPGRMRFAHALVRDAVYDMMPPTARARAHARAGQALERRRFGRIECHAAELAEHYRLAGASHARSAWTFAKRAARAAERSTPGEALRLLALASEAQARDELVTPLERESVLVGLGRAFHRTHRPGEAWVALAEAGVSALRRGDAVAAAHALLAITERTVWTWRTHGDVDASAIDLWEAVRAALPPSELELRARVGGALALELLYVPESAARSTQLVDESVATARRSGSRQALLQVLQLAHLALKRPDLLERRIPVADELIALATRLDDPLELAVALCKRAADRGESGAWDAARGDLTRARQLGERHQLVPVLIVTGFGLAMVEQAAGNFAQAQAALEEIETLQATVSLPGVGIGLCQLATMRLVQGRLAELEAPLRAAAAHTSLVRDLHALAVIADGRADEASVLLGEWAAQPPLLWDYFWTGLTIIRAKVWLALGEADAIGELRRQLTPYAGRLAVGGMSTFFFGSIAHTVGELALADGDLTSAKCYLRQAWDTHSRLGFTPLLQATDALLVAADAAAAGPGAAGRFGNG